MAWLAVMVPVRVPCFRRCDLESVWMVEAFVLMERKREEMVRNGRNTGASVRLSWKIVRSMKR